jgi:lysyl-tRNA synthetase class 2
MPSAELGTLRARARMLARIRAFFAERGVLEVETPALSCAGNPDPSIEPLRVGGPDAGIGTTPQLLHTSPEFAMKRLLAAGSGPIWQLARVFRADERGRWHNPEFSLLEWYRPGSDHHALMDEVAELFTCVCGWPAPVRTSYRELFVRFADVDPFTAGMAALESRARAGGARLEGEPRRVLLDWIMSHVVSPALAREPATFVHDYPADQAALARIRPGDPPLAERFELFVEGVELANGFHELADPLEQRRRFDADATERTVRGLAAVPRDEALLAALAAGLPDCAGVAVGFDRWVMLATGVDHIARSMAFDISRA